MTTPTAILTPPRPANAQLRRFSLLLKANILMYLRNRTALFWTLFFPIGYMILFGAIFGNQKISKQTVDSATFISYLVPGVVIMSLLSSGLIGNAASMAAWRERGFLRRIQATPLPVAQIILSKVIVQVAVMLVQSTILIIVSMLVYKTNFSFNALLKTFPTLLLCALLSMSMGQAIAAIVRKVDTVNIISQVVYFPLLFLSGLVIPFNQLPDFLQSFGKYLPSAMMGDLSRAALMSDLNTGGQSVTNLPYQTSLLGVVGYIIISLFIGIRFFKWR